MSGYVTLLGAEDVRAAASTMSSAASEMQRAASNVSDAFEAHQRFLTDWLQDFQTILDNSKHAYPLHTHRS